MKISSANNSPSFLVPKSKDLRRRRMMLSGYPKWMFMMRKSPHMRRWLVRNPWMRPVSVFNYAAISIQKLARGFIARLKLKLKFKQKSRAAIRSSKRMAATKKKAKASQLDKYLKCIDDYTRRRMVKPSWMEGGFSSWCAAKLQVGHSVSS